jgi:hypothetical protein
MGWLDRLFGRRTEAAEQAPRAHDPDRFKDHERPITVEEAERLHPGLAGDSRAERHPHIVKPFGFQSGEWEALKAQIEPGDQLLEYATSADSWAHLAGRAGIKLVRDGEVIADIVTMMN